MKSKTIKNIVIASVALVGVSYILKSIKAISEQQKIEKLASLNLQKNNSSQSSATSLMEEEKISDFSKLPDRKYYVLSRKKLSENSQTE